MARMSDYEPIIFETKNKVFELEKRIDFLENENLRLNRVISDTLVDLQMDINTIKQRVEYL